MRPVIAATAVVVLAAAWSQSVRAATPGNDIDFASLLRETPDGNFWRLNVSPYTVHYSNDDEDEHEAVYLIGIERQRSSGWLWGCAYFSNSFGQPSAYVYFGQQLDDFSPWPQLFAQWTIGIVYGYKAPYADKVPFNYNSNGFAPGATLSLGWQFTPQFSVQVNAIGLVALMFQASWSFR